MATLWSDTESVKAGKASWYFELTGVEHPEAWEGWYGYQMKLAIGSEVLAEVKGTIIDSDINWLTRLLIKAKASKGTYEPMEPDFYLDMYLYDCDEIDLRVFVDATAATGEHYSAIGPGLRLIVSKLDVQEFGQAILNSQSELNTTYGL